MGRGISITPWGTESTKLRLYANLFFNAFICGSYVFYSNFGKQLINIVHHLGPTIFYIGG